MQLKDLSPNILNPRKISDKRLKALEKSLYKFGDLSGFVFNVRSRQLISGHQRKKLFSENGNIVIEKTYQSPTQARTVAEGYVEINGERFKYREVDADKAWEAEALLAANKHGGEWDNEKLLEVFAIPNIDVELTGFEIDEIKISGLEDADEAYIASEEKTTEQIDTENPINAISDEKADSIPEAEIKRAKLSQIWKLGSHRLMCGDSKNPDNIAALTCDNDIELLLTDPPYGMSVVKADGNIGGNRVGKNGYGDKGEYGKEAKCGKYKPIISDDEPFDPAFLLSICKNQIIFGANHFSSHLPDSPHWIAWIKNMPEGTDFSGAELAWTSIKKKAVKTYEHTWAGMTRSGSRDEELTKRVHPTQKPVGMLARIIEDYTSENESVLDLFGGSGSTLIACEKTKRKCYMMELDPHYIDLILCRWEKYTGQTAELISEVFQ